LSVHTVHHSHHRWLLPPERADGGEDRWRPPGREYLGGHGICSDQAQPVAHNAARLFTYRGFEAGDLAVDPAVDPAGRRRIHPKPRPDLAQRLLLRRPRSFCARTHTVTDWIRSLR